MCKLGKLNEPVGFHFSSLNNLASRKQVTDRKKYKKKPRRKNFPSFQRNFRFANACNEIRR